MHTTPVRTYALTMVVVQLHHVGQSYHFVSWVSLQSLGFVFWPCKMSPFRVLLTTPVHAFWDKKGVMDLQTNIQTVPSPLLDVQTSSSCDVCHKQSLFSAKMKQRNQNQQAPNKIQFLHIHVTSKAAQFGESALLKIGSLLLFHLHLFRSGIVMNRRRSFCRIGRNPKSNADCSGRITGSVHNVSHIHHFSITPIMSMKQAGILSASRPH